jgi:hypothetical protein
MMANVIGKKYAKSQRSQSIELSGLWDFFNWCTFMNAGIIVVWFVFYLVAKDASLPDS